MTRALVLLALALPACASEAPVPPTVEVRGVYVRPLYDGQAAEVDHEAVGDRMPAMRMDMRVADPAVLSDLAPGDAAVFTVDSASLTTIWAATPLPSDTPLDLYDPEADTTASGIVLPD